MGCRGAIHSKDLSRAVKALQSSTPSSANTEKVLRCSRGFCSPASAAKTGSWHSNRGSGEQAFKYLALNLSGALSNNRLRKLETASSLSPYKASATDSSKSWKFTGPQGVIRRFLQQCCSTLHQSAIIGLSVTVIVTATKRQTLAQSGNRQR